MKSSQIGAMQFVSIRALFHRPLHLGPVGLVGTGTALVASAVPPAEDHISLEEATLIIPAPGAFMRAGRIGAQVARAAAADVIADIAAIVARHRKTAHRGWQECSAGIFARSDGRRIEALFFLRRGLHRAAIRVEGRLRAKTQRKNLSESKRDTHLAER